ncbi:MAG TPA: glycerol kinase GlpK [Candidatus Sulfotelmatobacter sp.]|nr:glycerol kinase GlpK [Candidatus Sulfotelmatobacter sp.]
MQAHILVIDQGTTSSRAIVFDRALSPVATAQQEFPQLFPASGWVEHDPEAIWQSTLVTAREALSRAGLGADAIAAIGIANQRETVLVWDRATGRPIHNAIVWQDRRTAAACEALEAAGHGPRVAERTGLRLDPYFSATKIGWILDRVRGARAQADAGALAFGTVDTFLLWRLTGGAVHATDATNASRTLLCNIADATWDDEMLALFGVPRAMLPAIRDSAGDFGTTHPDLFGAAIPIRGVAGDQQAALVGQACFRPGMVKATYGTGGFILLNTGEAPVASQHRLVTTIGVQLGGRRLYALEGSIFSAGSAVQWLRDGLGIIATAAESGDLAAAADPAQRVYLVPAFTGLGAPHWDSHARATVTGITRATTRRELARAALESVAYQTRDLLDCMAADLGGRWSGAERVLRVDGGMTASDWTLQFLADTLGLTVDRPTCLETTALGAAYLAGLDAGLYPPPERFAETWSRARAFTPRMPESERDSRYRGWQQAVAQARHAPGVAPD